MRKAIFPPLLLLLVALATIVSAGCKSSTEAETKRSVPNLEKPPGQAQCLSGCYCMTEAEARKYGYNWCKGQKMQCGYDAQQNPKYCFEPAATKITTPKPGRLVIDPSQDRNLIGTQHSLTFILYDSNGNPMSNIRIYVSHTGAHTFAPIELVTDQNGRSSYYYTGTNVGTDTIVARIDSLTATATKEWYSLQQPGATGQATQPRQCPSECFCLTKAEAEICGQTISKCQPSPCGFDSQGNPKYCYKPGFATPPPPEVPSPLR